MSQAFIQVGAPCLDGNEAKYVSECLETGWISSQGRFLAAFEKAFADYCGVRHAVAVNNGTTALHLALVGLGIGPGDEVLVPSLTYIASANSVRYCNATPVFVDNDPATFNLDPAQLESKITSRTRAIMPVHLYGRVADMDPIHAVAARYGLLVVEDAAEAVGACYKGTRTGALANCATFSFFGNKIITTGEGGMVTTNDEALAAKLRLHRGQGVDPERRYWFPVIGYNYRMTNVAAAIGLGQLERIDHHLTARRRIAEGYNQRLGGVEGLILPAPSEPEEHVNWMYTVKIKQSSSLEATAVQRDHIMTAMQATGIETRPVFYPMHVLPPYLEDAQRQKRLTGGWPHAEACSAAGLNLPTHTSLTDADLDRVSMSLLSALGQA